MNKRHSFTHSVKAGANLATRIMNIPLKKETNEDTLSEILDKEPKHPLKNILWRKLEQIPEVSFSILHNNTHICLKYYITEASMRAEAIRTNGHVWEDSCVEFFISTDDGESYFNFEFNSLGTRLAGYGADRKTRAYLPDYIVETISTKAIVTDPTPGHHQWTLFAAIPVNIFGENETLQGKTYSANFYKCGDKLPEPHFLSWSKVESPEPDFHLPGYFGEIVFQ